MAPKPFRDRSKIRLGNHRALRAELGVVYRACVRGELAWQDGRAATAILGAIASMDTDVDLAARIEALEVRLGEQHPAGRPNGGTYHARP